MKHVPVGPKLRAIANYRNMMYDIAGEAAINATGVSYEVLEREKFLKPLGLDSTDFTMSELTNKSNYVAEFSASSFSTWRPYLAMFPNEELEVALLTNADAIGIHSNVVYHVADVIPNLAKTRDSLTVRDHHGSIGEEGLHMAFGAIEGVLTYYDYDLFSTVLQHAPVKLCSIVIFGTGADRDARTV
ncbi:MAG: hypothetical protein BYD32DRAFT_474758 [Podila humilis]|nr:MAG: hypothetical protein BYD32DRAFT_474758 [Podila humilis]